MSNVIPIVSSSPPPLDDDEGYKWDSDDDEYGNFTSAPSISATTIASDSSFEVNWSTSETSFSANDGFSKGSSQNSSSKIQCDKGDLSPQSDSNISENVQSGFCLQSEGGILNGCEDIKTAGKSENFADFDNAKLNDGSFEVNIESKLGPHQDVILCLSQDVGHGTFVGVTEEVFQDSAQFNDTSVRESDKKATAKLGLSHSSQEGVEPNADGAIKATDHSNRSLQNSSPDHCTEASIVDSVSSVSVQWKNNDSTYSSVSTVDSGVFSTDLSPSYVQSEGSDLSLIKEKDDAVASRSAVSHQGDATSFCSTSVGAVGDADSLAAPVRLFKDTASSDNTISSTDTPEVCAESVSSTCEHSDALADSNNTLSSSHQQNEIESTGTAAVPEKEYSAEVLSDNRECVTDPTGANGFQHPEHSTLPPKTEPSDHSDSSREGNTEATGPSDLAFFSEPPCLEHSGESLSESCAGDHRTKGSNNVEAAAGIVSSDESRSQDEGHLSVSRSSRESESTLGCGHDVQRSGDISVKCEDSDGAGLNLNSHSADVWREVQGHDQGSVSSESHSTSVKSTEDAAHAESSLQNTGSELEREAEERHENTEGCEENKDDKEFGDFSSVKDRKNSDSHEEVAPITFRTSICEAMEENEDDEDFTFVRERPPAFTDEGDDDSGEFGEFGTASKDVSDDDDDFGEFDSAENIKPSSSPATNLGKNVKDGDEVRDTNGPKTAEDDWADFGAVAPSEESNSFSGLSASQTVLVESSEQSKAEKLHCAVLSCFPESPMPVSAQNQSQTSINKEDRHESFSQDSFSRDGSPKEDEGPLPLDTVVDLGLTKALEAKQQTWAVVQHPAKKDPKVRLWAHLKDLDSCNALSYGWSTSHCSKEVFSTLHIDTQNVLFTQKKQAVPFFASGLGILEPIRGGGGATSDGKKGRSSMSPPQSALLDNNRHDHLQNSSTQDIPPVDFDWSTSGLTNPLTANTLDLDFLVIQGCDSYEKTSDEWDWVFKAENQDSARIPLQPLEEILKKTTPTAKFVTNEVLSPEAVRILEKMPDLSFMHSAVLMFPVKQ